MNPAMSNTRIEILMAVHQPGLGFLEKQVQSIRDQSLSNWRLLIMLDGEHPELMDVIHRWISEDDRIRCEILPGHSGCCRTFEAGLLRLKGNDSLVALADQDDVWEPKKLEVLANAIRREPEAMMVFCDSSIIDANDREVSHSLFKTEHRVPEFSLVSLWARNSISGHAQLFRSKLLDICTPFPEGLCASGLNHDHWLAMSAAHAGKIRFVDQALVRHRLHDSNHIGPRISPQHSRPNGGLSAWQHHNRRLRFALESRHRFLHSLPGFGHPPLSLPRLLACALLASLRRNLPAAGVFLRASLARPAHPAMAQGRSIP